MSHRILGAALVAVLAPSSLAQQVLVVDDDPGPGVDLSDLASAVAFAPDGAILLLRDGTYSGFELDRPLTIVADVGATATVTGPVVVRDLPPSSSALVRGLRFAVPPLFFIDPPELVIDSCAGEVRLEDLDLTAVVPFSIPPWTTSMNALVSASLDVRMARLRIGAESAPEPVEFGAPAPALAADASRISLYDCSVRGASGAGAGVDPGTVLQVNGQVGGVAIACNWAQLDLFRCDITGGAGGDGLFSLLEGGCTAAGDGGAGVTTSGIPTTLYVAGSAVTGGKAGAPGVRPWPGLSCLPSDDGDAFDQLSGGLIFAEFADETIAAVTDAVVREDEPLIAAFEGQPGAVGFWAVGLEPLSGDPATSYLDPAVVPLVVLPFSLDASGAAALAIPAVGDVLPTGTGVVLHHQAATLTPSGIVAGGWSSQVLVDAAF